MRVQRPQAAAGLAKVEQTSQYQLLYLAMQLLPGPRQARVLPSQADKAQGAQDNVPHTSQQALPA